MGIYLIILLIFLVLNREIFTMRFQTGVSLKEFVVKFYTGIGSEKTPKQIQYLMTNIAYKLALLGYCLRSGGARGADTAFENGVDKFLKDYPNSDSNSYKKIYTAEEFEFSKENYNFCCKQLIPILDENRDFSRFKEYTQKLLLRDVQQVLGNWYDSIPSKFTIFWIPMTNIWDPNAGGTKYATRISERNNIPLFNLFEQSTRKRLENFVGS